MFKVLSLDLSCFSIPNFTVSIKLSAQYMYRIDLRCNLFKLYYYIILHFPYKEPKYLFQKSHWYICAGCKVSFYDVSFTKF